MKSFDPKTTEEWKEIDAKMAELGFTQEEDASIFDRQYNHKNAGIYVSLHPYYLDNRILSVETRFYWRHTDFIFEVEKDTYANEIKDLEKIPIPEMLRDVVKTFDWINDHPFPVSVPDDISDVAILGYSAKRKIKNYTFVRGLRFEITNEGVRDVSKDPTGVISLAYVCALPMSPDPQFWRDIPSREITPTGLKAFYQSVINWAIDPNNPYRIAHKTLTDQKESFS